MSKDLRALILDLEAARVQKQRELDSLTTSIRQLQQAVVLLPDEALPEQEATAFRGMGVTEAARAYYLMVNHPLTTRDLADGMLARGWRTRSRNITNTIHATLTKSREWVRDSAGGTWTYVGRQQHRTPQPDQAG